MTIPLKERFSILERDRFTCRYCGKRATETQLEVDHVQSRKDGGGDDPANLVASCLDCNRGKSGRTVIPPRSSGGSIVGHFFHTFKDGFIQNQGVVLEDVGGGFYVVQLFEWFAGTPAFYGRRIASLEQACREGWAFYETDEAMREAYEYGGGMRRIPGEQGAPNGKAYP